MHDPTYHRPSSAESARHERASEPRALQAVSEHSAPDDPTLLVGTALRIMVETSEYISDRSTHLSSNVREGIKATETLAAVARQIRTLSSNTSLEASRVGGNATVAEIARQMRLLSQQVTALSEHLSSGFRSQGVTLGEMTSAIDTLLADAATAQGVIERGIDSSRPGSAVPLLGLLRGIPESAAVTERAAHG